MYRQPKVTFFLKFQVLSCVVSQLIQITIMKRLQQCFCGAQLHQHVVMCITCVCSMYVLHVCVTSLYYIFVLHVCVKCVCYMCEVHMFVLHVCVAGVC